MSNDNLPLPKLYLSPAGEVTFDADSKEQAEEYAILIKKQVEIQFRDCIRENKIER